MGCTVHSYPRIVHRVPCTLHPLFAPLFESFDKTGKCMFA